MNLVIKAISAACLMALCPLTASPQSVDGDPQAVDQADSPAAPSQDGAHIEHFDSTMNRAFGPGQWRRTSGYRSPAQEDELRRHGAGTVPVGQLSHHSLGSPAAPGAYDVVVAGMSARTAAMRLRNDGDTFAKVIVEGAHGPQGAHLHIEPNSAQIGNPAPKPDSDDTIYLRISGGKRNPLLARTSLATAREN